MQDAETHNAAVHEASRLLREKYLPALARKWMTGRATDVDSHLHMEDDHDGDDEPADGQQHRLQQQQQLSASAASLSWSQRSLSSFPATFDPDAELSATSASCSPADIRFLRLSEELHCHGLNCRHLGLLRHHLLSQFPPSQQLQDTALLLLVEAVSRTLKNLLRHQLRLCVARASSQTGCAEYAAVRCCVRFLNLSTAAQPSEAAAFWHGELPRELQARFGQCCLQPGEAERLLSLVSPHLLRVVSYLCLSCGIALSPSCESALSASPLHFAFTVVDVEMRVTSRSLSIVDYAEARVVMAEAEEAARGGRAPALASAVRLLTLAVQIFDRLRHSDPFDLQYRTEARRCRRELSRLQALQQQQLLVQEAQLHSPRRDEQLAQPSQTIRTGLSASFARFDLQPLTQPAHSSGSLSLSLSRTGSNAEEKRGGEEEAQMLLPAPAASLPPPAAPSKVSARDRASKSGAQRPQRARRAAVRPHPTALPPLSAVGKRSREAASSGSGVADGGRQRKQRGSKSRRTEQEAMAQ